MFIGKDSPALGLHEEIRILEQSLQELRGRLATAHEARDRLGHFQQEKNREIFEEVIELIP